MTAKSDDNFSEKNSCNTRRISRLSLWIMFTLGAHLAWAQETPSNDDTVELQPVAVTGSSIKRINAETASPLQIVTRQQIENMGAKTLLQVLNNLPAAGRAPLQDFRSMFTGTDGASQVGLRGLGAQGTLVLLNGRRLSFYGAPSGFQYQFVNIDTIPAAVIERMEVLTDGASAIYGSDAVAGVINIITRREYQGLELDLSTSASERVSAYGEHQGTLTFGFGDLDTDRYNIFASISRYRRDPVYWADMYDKMLPGWHIDNPNWVTNFRIDTGSPPGEMNPGTLFAFDSAGRRRRMAAPGCNHVVAVNDGSICAANLLAYDQAHQPKSDRTTVYLGGRYLFANDMEAYAEMNGTHIDMYSHTNPARFNSGSTWTWFARETGFNLNTFVIPYLSPNHPYNQLTPELAAMMDGVAGLEYRFLEDPGIFHQRNRDRNYRVLAGLRGAWGQWDFDTVIAVAGTHSALNQDTNLSVSGFHEVFGPFSVDTVSGRLLINDRARYEFGIPNRDLVQRLYPDNIYHSRTKLMSWDGKVEGHLGTLPTGEVRSAFGFNLMREEFFAPGNPDAAAGDVAWQGGTWFKGERNVVSMFGEVLLPISHRLEANVALRMDKYPDFSVNFAPKLGLRYQMNPNVLLRGTYSESFRAPGLAESGTGGIYQQATLNDEVRCDETNAIANVLRRSAIAADIARGNELLNSNCITVVGSITEPNPELKPETAKIATMGVVFQPWPNVDLSMDYFIVSRRDEIIRQDFREAYLEIIAQYGPGMVGAPNGFRREIDDIDRSVMAEVQAMCANPANAGVCTGQVPGYTVGNMSGIITDYLNRGRTLVDGFDFDAQARFGLGRAGRLNMGLKTTIMHREKYDNEDGTGWSGNWVGLYGTPRVSAVLNANWQYRQFNAGMFVNYSGGHSWVTSLNDPNPRYTRERCTNEPNALSPEQCARGAPSYTTVNLNLGWKVNDHFKLGVNVQNLFSRLPYYDPVAWEGFDHRFNLWRRVWMLHATILL